MVAKDKASERKEDAISIELKEIIRKDERSSPTTPRIHEFSLFFVRKITLILHKMER